ncbi:hypothetical protein D3C81_11010 [compost metagenome]
MKIAQPIFYHTTGMIKEVRRAAIIYEILPNGKKVEGLFRYGIGQSEPKGLIFLQELHITPTQFRELEKKLTSLNSNYRY